MACAAFHFVPNSQKKKKVLPPWTKVRLELDTKKALPRNCSGDLSGFQPYPSNQVICSQNRLAAAPLFVSLDLIQPSSNLDLCVRSKSLGRQRMDPIQAGIELRSKRYRLMLNLRAYIGERQLLREGVRALVVIFIIKREIS